jgi:hypothetical protein
VSQPQHIQLTLHGNAVVAPALRAIEQSIEIVSFCLVALEQADLSKPIEFEASRFQMKFANSDASTESRKAEYVNWILSRGFQELARGIRQMLEEAFFYNSMIEFSESKLPQTRTWGELQERMSEFREAATRASFPELMKLVNIGLTSPLHFESEFLSLQKVRNCLEHRGGTVAEKDTDPTTKLLRLALPRVKIFREEQGKEIELGKGSHVEKDTLVGFKNVVEEREFKLGERIVFNPSEFHDIGYGCWLFASDLGSKLPQLKDKVTNQQA